MKRVPTEVSAIERARWLAELAHALEEAQKLVWQIGQSGRRTAEAMELYGRLETLRIEVQAMRIARSDRARGDFDPEWSDYSPWSKPSADEGG